MKETKIFVAYTISCPSAYLSNKIYLAKIEDDLGLLPVDWYKEISKEEAKEIMKSKDYDSVSFNQLLK